MRRFSLPKQWFGDNVSGAPSTTRGGGFFVGCAFADDRMAVQRDAIALRAVAYCERASESVPTRGSRDPHYTDTLELDGLMRVMREVEDGR